MKSLGIMWNLIGQFKEDVLSDIKQRAEILEVVDLNLSDRYEEFVRKIYSVDDIAEWKVDKKIETMFLSSKSRTVTIVIMDISTKETYFHPYKKRLVFTNLENLKTDIRERYSKLIPVYFFDNIFHLTDDEHEFNADFEIINNFINSIEQKQKVLSLEPKRKKI